MEKKECNEWIYIHALGQQATKVPNTGSNVAWRSEIEQPEHGNFHRECEEIHTNI
jgi:hypothetical protein